MSLEQRREYLMNAALRAELRGDHAIAHSLRRMADETRPIDRSLTLVLAEGVPA